jgi:hypothetical protein
MAQTIETTPNAAPSVTLKSAQISEFLRGLQENEERKLTLKEHMTACFEDFREAIEVKGYSYDSLAKQLKKIGLQVSSRSLRDAYTNCKKNAKTTPSATMPTPASGGSAPRKSAVKAPAAQAGD